MSPLENRSRFTMESDVFSRKLRVALNSKAAGRMVFLARDQWETIKAERDAKRAGEVSGDPSKMVDKPYGADYQLRGWLGGLSSRSRRGQEDYLLYTFSLTNLESSAVVWEDEFETKRAGQEGAEYR
jgi:hypothetical protein